MINENQVPSSHARATPTTHVTFTYSSQLYVMYDLSKVFDVYL
jgi:hypothetical protein